ncbi:response regulator [Thermodesulfobacteriota bacterium]
MVDDDKLTRDFVANVLTFSVNREVQSFDSGFSAWNYIKTGERPDIIVSDVDMPEMDGFDLLSRVKKRCPDKICIMMSGDPENEISAKRLGADAFLAKPFGLNDLFNIVETYIVKDN